MPPLHLQCQEPCKAAGAHGSSTVGRVPHPSKKVIKMEGIKRLCYRSSLHKERVSCFGEKSVPRVRSDPGVGKSVNSLLPVEYAK